MDRTTCALVLAAVVAGRSGAVLAEGGPRVSPGGPLTVIMRDIARCAPGDEDHTHQKSGDEFHGRLLVRPRASPPGRRPARLLSRMLVSAGVLHAARDSSLDWGALVGNDQGVEVAGRGPQGDLRG